MGHISCKNHLKMITFKTQSINLVSCDSYVDPQRSFNLKLLKRLYAYRLLNPSSPSNGIPRGIGIVVRS